jgi:aconitate hydratase
VFASTGEVLPVWRAAARYADNGLPLVIIAGERYGTGSSRDWAAKGAQMLGARAVLANSFEQIHRANLIGMGVLPLRLPQGWRAGEMRITPRDTVELGLDLRTLSPRCDMRIVLRRAEGGEAVEGIATALLDTDRDVDLLRAGGMIPMILRRALASEE